MCNFWHTCLTRVWDPHSREGGKINYADKWDTYEWLICVWLICHRDSYVYIYESDTYVYIYESDIYVSDSYVYLSHTCEWVTMTLMSDSYVSDSYVYPHMGWLRSVGSIKSQVSFAEYSLFCRALLQKRPLIWSILLTKATPYRSYSYV